MTLLVVTIILFLLSELGTPYRVSFLSPFFHVSWGVENQVLITQAVVSMCIMWFCGRALVFRLQQRWARLFVFSCYAGVSIFFFGTLYTALTLGSPIGIHYLEKFLPDFWDVRDLVPLPYVFSVGGLLVTDFLLFLLAAPTKNRWHVRAAFVSIFSLAPVAALFLVTDRTDVLFHPGGLSQSSTISGALSSKALREHFELKGPPIFIASERYDRIYVVMMESLSAIHMSRYRHLQEAAPQEEFLPELEALAAERGVVFTNAISNASYSDASTFSLLTGCPAVDKSNLPFTPFKRESMPESNVFRSFARAGFKTAMLTSSRIESEGYDRIKDLFGLDISVGRDEVPLLRDHPVRPTYDSPPDTVLYKATEEVLPSEGKVVALLVTTSGHAPWRSLETGEVTGEFEVFRGVDKAAADFVRRTLQREKNSLVLVVGDHRKFSEPSDAEWEYFGGSAPFRIALFAFANDLVPRVEERYVVQSYLLRDIDKLLTSGPPLFGGIILHDHVARVSADGRAYGWRVFLQTTPWDLSREFFPGRVSKFNELELYLGISPPELILSVAANERGCDFS